MRRLAIPAAFAGALALGGAANAADAPYAPTLYAPAPAPDFFELRIGGSAQDPWGPEQDTANVTGEFLTRKLFRTDNRLADVFVPRLHVGGSLNVSGKTSFAYAGFTWGYDVTEQLFLEGSFGGALHDGDTGRFAKPGHAALGCSPLFRESASIGWRFTPNWSVMATVEHLSNAGLCDQNRGLTNIGARIGYRF